VFRCPTPSAGAWLGDDDFSAVMTSDDCGQTWTERVVPDSVGLVHMNIHQAGSGQLVALFRSRWADFVYRSVSRDAGDSWEAPVPTELPNNNSSLQFATLHDGRLAVVLNPTSHLDATDRRESLYDEIEDQAQDQAEHQAEDQAEDQAEVGGTEQSNPGRRRAFWGTPRAPIVVAMSSDDGLTWPIRRVIEDGDGFAMTNNSADRLNRELSYPSIHQTADGRVHVTYTHHRQVIRYVSFQPDWASAATDAEPDV
jgi:predicted neuraminidase